MGKVLSLREAGRVCRSLTLVATLLCAVSACLADERAPGERALEAASQPASQPAVATRPAASPLLPPSGQQPALPELPSIDNGDYAGAMWQLLSAVVVVAVLGAAALLLTKKLLPRIGRATGRRIAVLETVYLGPRKAVHLIQVGSRKLLVASSSEGVARLDDVTDAFADYAEVARHVAASQDPQEQQQEPRE